MDCRIAQEQIMERLDCAGPGKMPRDLEVHLAGCPDCAPFAARQMAVDARLSAILAPPELSPEFRTALRRHIGRDTARIWADTLPEKVHFASCGLATVVCAIFLPFAAPMVLTSGAAATLITYVVLTVLRNSFEEAEEPSR